jgi:hypothetical protein
MSGRDPPEHSRFKKGQSGNPGGRALGMRERLNKRFIKALSKDFEANGTEAIAKAREKDPIGYMRVLASLQPKAVDVSVDHKPAEDSMSRLDIARRILFDMEQTERSRMHTQEQSGSQH